MTTRPSPALKFRLPVFVLALCLAASTPAAATAQRRERAGDADQPPSQQPPQQQRQRVTRDAILARLRAAASPEQRADVAQSLAAAVRESGVDFELTPQAEQELRESGATAELVEAVRANLRPLTSGGPAQSQVGAGQGAGRQQPSPAERDPAMTDGPPAVTRHAITVNGRRLRYTVTTGVMPLKSATGETEARIFYMAYTLDGGHRTGERPLMFSFNGGPALLRSGSTSARSAHAASR